MVEPSNGAPERDSFIGALGYSLHGPAISLRMAYPIAKVLTDHGSVIAVGLYVLGFLVHSMFLGSFGVSGFDALRLRYFSSGVSAVLFGACVLAPTIHVVTRALPSTIWSAVSRSATGSAAISMPLFFTILVISRLGREHPDRYKPAGLFGLDLDIDWFLFMVCIAGFLMLTCTMLYFFARFRFSGARVPLFRALAGVGVAVFLSTAALSCALFLTGDEVFQSSASGRWLSIWGVSTMAGLVLATYIGTAMARLQKARDRRRNSAESNLEVESEEAGKGLYAMGASGLVAGAAFGGATIFFGLFLTLFVFAVYPILPQYLGGGFAPTVEVHRPDGSMPFPEMKTRLLDRNSDRWLFLVSPNSSAKPKPQVVELEASEIGRVVYSSEPTGLSALMKPLGSDRTPRPVSPPSETNGRGSYGPWPGRTPSPPD